MIAWLYLNWCPVRPNSKKLEDHTAACVALREDLTYPKLLYYALLCFHDAKSTYCKISTGYLRSCTMLPRQQLNTHWTEWYISERSNLKCCSLLGGTKGEVSYLPLFGLKHSQQYPTSLPIWFTLSMSLSWMHSSSLNSWVGVVRLRQRKQ